jgi:hypothetical protein
MCMIIPTRAFDMAVLHMVYNIWVRMARHAGSLREEAPPRALMWETDNRKGIHQRSYRPQSARSCPSLASRLRRHQQRPVFKPSCPSRSSCKRPRSPTDSMQSTKSLPLETRRFPSCPKHAGSEHGLSLPVVLDCSVMVRTLPWA